MVDLSFFGVTLFWLGFVGNVIVKLNVVVGDL